MVSDAWEEIRSKLGIARASKPMLVGMTAILVLVAAALGYVLADAATASDFEVASQERETQADEAVQDQPPLFVHVSGAVARPGLYELPPQSRVADAVQAAGGFTEEAAEDSCNLARHVEDGEHVVVLNRTQLAAGGAQDVAGPAGSPSSGMVNINTASAEQLESLPGIGSSTARKIVEDRTANGPFQTVGELTRVSGVGDKKLAALEGLICV